MSRTLEKVLYYISDKVLYIQNFEIYNKDVLGFVEVVFDKDDITIVDLYSSTYKEGIGTYLMLHACKEAKKRGVKNITLDDCSERYRQKHNIYTKLGMVYVDSDGGPEMVGSINDILTNTKLIPNIIKEILIK